MSRGLTAEMQTGIAAPIVRPVFFYEAVFGVNTHRYWSNFGPIVWNTFTWYGIGNLLQFAPFQETTELKASGMTFRLSGIDPTFVELVKDDLQSGSLGKVFLGLLDSNGGLINSPRIIFRGKLDTAEINYSDPLAPIINFQYETMFIDLERTRDWRNTDAHQRYFHPGDTSMRHVASLQDRQLTWFSV